MTAYINGRPVRDVLEEKCRERGHVPVVLRDCDDWPHMGCVCRLTNTKARACNRCRILLLDIDGKKPLADSGGEGS